jgi:hypothetical protein
MSPRPISLIIALVLAGCDPFYGVESGTPLAGPVDVKCVNAAVVGVLDAGPVTYQRDENRSTEILPKQRQVLTVMHVWRYGERGSDVIQINETPDGWTFRNARSRMGVAVPHEEMTRFVPLMQKVNRAIQTRCGLPVANLGAQPVGDTKAREL